MPHAQCPMPHPQSYQLMNFIFPGISMSEQQNVTKMLIPKMRFVVGLLGFLLAGSVSVYAHENLENAKLIEADYSPQRIKNTSLNLPNNSTIPKQVNLTNSSLKLTPNFSFQTTPTTNRSINNLYQPQL